LDARSWGALRGYSHAEAGLTSLVASRPETELQSSLRVYVDVVHGTSPLPAILRKVFIYNDISVYLLAKVLYSNTLLAKYYKQMGYVKH
jgi:hypothetical protein